MNWKNITSIPQLDEIIADNQIHAIFKHSTRCPVSSMAKRSLEFNEDLLPEGASIFYLDLIAHRDVSNAIAEKWNIRHESPQVLIVKGTEALYNASHEDIDMADIAKFFTL
ncbi:bacillithiol system redox-active protein YtxJ [Sphingobacterium spiritivorum]|uniref:bacillithiol system redox-active protein YtxJ n=1 Tax=Sphingobacterium spiritivorum TaxID=258 RepID=UPI001919817D|nr:bacillithiol system redox-active protein YtxJ [Sphingobacterium spiritivorum]QQT27923.1 bacillithiol system redox-active protein YtxJ [Sphingobacterium spiritivorum]